jgi:hypothetical protein
MKMECWDTNINVKDKMRKILQRQIEKIECDISGEDLSNKDHCFLEIPLLVADKEILKAHKGEEDIYYDLKYWNTELNNEIGFEIYKFLKRKYPEQILKMVDHKNYKIISYPGEE